MFDSIGSLINKIPNSVILLIMAVASILFLLVNFWSQLLFFIKKTLSLLNIQKFAQKPKKQPLTPKQIEILSTSVVGKFLTADFYDDKELLAKKGALISEHIAFEAEKRGLLEKLASIAVFWPIENQ